jgi:putative ABC transport system permease protein
MKRFIHTLIRQIRQHALFSAINFAGMVLGLSCIVVIGFWIKTELGYDRFHKNVNSIYRVHRYFYDENGSENLHLPNVAAIIGPLLQREFHEISHIARIYHTGLDLRVDNQKMPDANICLAEPDLLNIFTFEELAGDTNLLARPFTAIVSDETAGKYFKDQPAIGKTLEFTDQNGKHLIEITGVFKKWQQNSHFRPDVVVSFGTYETLTPKAELEDWSSNNYETYFTMSAMPPEIDKRLDAFINKYLENGTSYTRIGFEPLTEIHFNWYSSRTYLYILISIALLILLLAGINFTNLNTAVYLKQMKSLKIRKIIGASKKALVFQMLSESVVFCVASLLVALYVAHLVLPLFNSILNNPIETSFGDSSIMLGFLLLSILTGIFSGLYPAWVIARMKTATIHTRESLPAVRAYFRNGLVVFQFAVSVTLIISFLFVSKQLNYMRNTEMGLDKENIVVVPATPLLIEKLDIFKQQLSANPNIVGVTASKRIPSDGLWDSNGARIISGGKPIPLGFRLANVRIDEQFIHVFKIPLVAGRNFYENIGNDPGYLINETAVKKIGWKSNEDALGQIIEYGNVKATVIGVVRDFHYESLRNPITPIILYYTPEDFNRVSIRIAPVDLDKTLSFIEKTWQTYNNTDESYYSVYLAERYRNLYKTEENIRTIFIFCMVLALSIAVLGLIGLSVFLIERRTKEIGIRKVNGATILEVMGLLNKDFLGWVILALMIACPLAWFAMHKWLQNFAYHTNLSWWVFVAAGMSALAIALLTVSWQSWRAAKRNPVEALRYE